MGKFLNRFKDGFKEGITKTEKKIEGLQNRPHENFNHQKLNPKNKENDSIGSAFDYSEDLDEFDSNMQDPNDFRYDDEFGIQPAQKPESFHHFILENQYKDLERSIRGLKDVFDKETQSWRTKRKDAHCFTDEEAEDILRTAQSHLATDIKLGWIRKDSFGLYMNAIYKELAFLFESIAEYRYGRYQTYELQYAMKLQNQKVFLELFTRIQANYSRAIEGQENKATHGSVRGQESLQYTDRDRTNRQGGYI